MSSSSSLTSRSRHSASSGFISKSTTFWVDLDIILAPRGMIKNSSGESCHWLSLYIIFPICTICVNLSQKLHTFNSFLISSFWILKAIVKPYIDLICSDFCILLRFWLLKIHSCLWTAEQERYSHDFIKLSCASFHVLSPVECFAQSSTDLLESV